MLTETERLRFNLLQERKQNNTLRDANKRNGSATSVRLKRKKPCIYVRQRRE